MYSTSSGEDSLPNSKTETPIITVTNNGIDDNTEPLKALIIYVKQSYSLSGFCIQTPCVSCESLATVIDLNNNQIMMDEQKNLMKPLCACPISLEILMLLSLKRIPFDVKLCNPTKMLPEELRCRMMRNLPVLVDPNNNNRTLEYRMDLIEYLQEQYPNRQLDIPDENRSDFTWDLINTIHMVSRRFYHYVQQHHQPSRNNRNFMAVNNVEKIRRQLFASLAILNRILSFFGTRYACTDDYPTVIDCRLMPRLHQIRVLLENLDDVKIPNGYRYLWQYLSESYDLEEFRRWCPSNQEIVIHWMKKTNYERSEPRLYRNKLMGLIRSSPTYSFKCPIYHDQVTRL